MQKGIPQSKTINKGIFRNILRIISLKYLKKSVPGFNLKIQFSSEK